MQFKKYFLTAAGALVIMALTGTAMADSRLNAYWIHGTIIEPEYPGRLTNTQRKGWGTIFTGKENNFNWFHIMVPTPVIEENTRVSLKKFFVLFRTIGDARITNIHVWDGRTKIWAKDGMNLSGWHLNIGPADTFPVDPMISLKTGLDICVRVQFGSKSGTTDPAIHFSTAGADFYRSW
ncbi:MAG: DUF6623 family protein [Desulfobacteraceae bacterium]